MRRHFLIPFLLLATPLVVGCAATAEDSDEQAGAISPQQAVENERFATQQRVLSGVPATAENAKRLGITSWTVFAVNDARKGVAGTVAYAVDGDGDVKYAVATMSKLDGSGVDVGLVQLAKDGAKTSFDVATATSLFAALRPDIALLENKLAAKQGGSGGECALRMAAVGIGIVGAAVAGVVVGSAGVALASGATLVDFLVALFVSAQLAPAAAAAGVGVAAIISVASDEVRRVVWTDTVEACGGGAK